MVAILMRIGTRKSVMALVQTEEIARRLAVAAPDVGVEIVGGGGSVRQSTELAIGVGNLLHFGGVFDGIALGILVIRKQIVAKEMTAVPPTRGESHARRHRRRP